MKLSSPACERNRDAIAVVLRRWLPPSGLVLEVASGTGEHAVHFAGAFPGLRWLPSDPDAEARLSIEAWRTEAGMPNLLPPATLDAAAADWPVVRCDAILCINMVHISPWSATLGLLAGAARLLGPGAPLILYGPFLQRGVATAPSNEAFDASLRSRDPAWGIRFVEDVVRAAAPQLTLAEIAPVPANNLSLLLRRTFPPR